MGTCLSDLDAASKPRQHRVLGGSAQARRSELQARVRQNQVLCVDGAADGWVAIGALTQAAVAGDGSGAWYDRWPRG